VGEEETVVPRVEEESEMEAAGVGGCRSVAVEEAARSMGWWRPPAVDIRLEAVLERRGAGPLGRTLSHWAARTAMTHALVWNLFD
jgi:hypothetical protein